VDRRHRRRAGRPATRSGGQPAAISVAVGERVVFTAETFEHGRELWESTGGSARRLTDVWPGYTSGTAEEIAASADGAWVFFSAAAEALWREPYRVSLSFFADGFESGDTDAWSSTTP
jgi:ELWxxDGT repeat protein